MRVEEKTETNGCNGWEKKIGLMNRKGTRDKRDDSAKSERHRKRARTRENDLNTTVQ
jgi:hypothetical protein